MGRAFRQHLEDSNNGYSFTASKYMCNVGFGHHNAFK